MHTHNIYIHTTALKINTFSFFFFPLQRNPGNNTMSTLRSEEPPSFFVSGADRSATRNNNNNSSSSYRNGNQYNSSRESTLLFSDYTRAASNNFRNAESAASSRLSSWSAFFFCATPYSQVLTLTGILAVLAVIFGTVMMFVGVSWNVYGDRTCQDFMILRSGYDTAYSCFGPDALQRSGCENVGEGTCWIVHYGNFPRGCNPYF